MKIVLRCISSASIAVFALLGPSLGAAADGPEGAPQQGAGVEIAAPPIAGVAQPPTDNTRSQAGSKGGGPSLSDSIDQIGRGIKGILGSIFGAGTQGEQKSSNRDTDAQVGGSVQDASREQFASNSKLFQRCDKPLAAVTITDSQQMVTQSAAAYYQYNLPPLSKIAGDVGKGLNCFDVLDNDPMFMASSTAVQPDFILRVRPVAIVRTSRQTRVHGVSIGVEVLCINQRRVIAEFTGTETGESFQSDKRFIYTWHDRPNMVQELVGRAYMTAQTELVSFLSSRGNVCNEPGATASVADQTDKTMVASTQRIGTESVRLIQALKAGDEKGARILIGNGADVNATDEEYGASALHWAILNGYRSIAELLIEKGANVNAKTKNGATPTFAAASLGQRDVLEVLIARGADLNAKDEQGVSPLRVASSKGHKAVVELLKAKGARF